MLRRFAWGTLLFTLAVIAWGAFVRASGSGAGCGAHWPLCNGEVVPRPEAIETVIELAHRVTSGLSLLAVLALALFVFRTLPSPHPARLAAAASVFFMLTEAAVGAGLVLLELVADDASPARAYWMAGHLLNTFLLLGALTATAWWVGAGKGARPRKPSGSTRWLLGAALFGVLILGASGAIAALGDTLYPATSLAEGLREEFAPGAALLLRLRVAHPALAFTVGAFLVVAVPYLGRRGGDAGSVAISRLVAWIVLAQLAAGVVNVLLLAPIWLQIVHLLLADALWIALVLFGLTSSTERAGTRVAPSAMQEKTAASGRAG
ncbi:MAG: COX15/CtaA family protein [Gemmatimonadota bacterium]